MGFLYLVGGLNPSEKYESQVSWDDYSDNIYIIHIYIYYEKKQNMFQTTNQNPSWLNPSNVPLAREWHHPPESWYPSWHVQAGHPWALSGYPLKSEKSKRSTNKQVI